MRTITLALVGCGGMGRRHVFGLRKLRELDRATPVRFALRAVIDRDRARAERLADEAEALLGLRPAVFDDVSNALSSGAAECLDICTASETHYGIGLGALTAGVHLFVEKPLTVTIAEATELIQIAERTNRVLAVAENVRREPVNRLTRHAIAAGLIGDVRFVNDAIFTGGDAILLTPWRHRRSTGGPMLDVGVHNADLIEYLAGPVDEVWGKARIDEPIRVRRPSPVKSAAFYEAFDAGLPDRVEADAEDVGIGVLQFASGAIGQWTIHQAHHGRPWSTRTIHGSVGAFELPPDRSGGRPVVQLGSGARYEGDEIARLLTGYRLDPFEAAVWGATAPSRAEGDFAEIDRALLAIELNDLGLAIAGERRPEVDGIGGRRNMALLYSLLESSASGRSVRVDDVESGRVRQYQDAIGVN